LGFFGSNLSPMPASHELPVVTAGGCPRLLSHLRTVNCSAMELRLPHNSCLPGLTVARFFAFAAAAQNDHGSDET
jgi:hypothetical protein